MRQRITQLLAGVLIALNLVVLFAPAAGAATPPPRTNCGKQADGFLKLPTWYKYLNPTFDAAKKECKLEYPKGTGKIDFEKAIGPILLAVFEIILFIGGMVAVAFIIYGGFQYMLSQGDMGGPGKPGKTALAKQTIINALIGLVITISSTAIVNLIARNIT